jgi:carboxyl-terminal processing protease
VKSSQEWALAGVVAGILVFVAHQGSFVGIQASFSADAGDLAGIAEVRALIQRRWVEDPKPGQLLNGALSGMAGTLDRFSEFISAEQREQFEQSTTGRFGGLGVWISVADGLLTVISPIEGTPAWKAGLLPGDAILRVDGKPAEYASVSAAVQDLKGKIGTTVKLEVLHKGETKTVIIEVTRAQIQIHSIKGTRLLDVERRIGFVRITTFNSGTLDELRAAVDWFVSVGVRGLIVDLRGNPGGFLDQAVQVANLWLPDEAVIVRTWSREHQKYKDTVANSEQPLAGVKTAVLIDGGSASASEVLAGALVDQKAAKLVGERTYGKGSVQTILSVLGNRAQLKLTTQYYFTPEGRRIHRGKKENDDPTWGLLPDLAVPVSQRERWRLSNEESDREMRRLQARARGEEHEEAERLHIDDPQVRAAYKLLLGELDLPVPAEVLDADTAPVGSAGTAAVGSASTAPVKTGEGGVAPVESR